MVGQLRTAVTGIACLALALALSASPVVAGAGEAGEVVFRVTHEGPVPPTHGFAIECGPSSGGENLCFSVEDVVILLDEVPEAVAFGVGGPGVPHQLSFPSRAGPAG